MKKLKAERNLRDPVSTRNKILEVAFFEMYSNGFNGTSTNVIIDKLDMTRGAFFHHFPSKDILGYVMVDDILTSKIVERWIEPIKVYKNPIDGIIKNFTRLINEHKPEHILLGCPLNNLIQELSGSRPVFQKKLQAVMELWVNETQKLLTSAKKDGYLNKSVKTRDLAEFIVSCQESAFAMSKAMNNLKPARTIVKNLKTHISNLS